MGQPTSMCCTRAPEVLECLPGQLRPQPHGLGCSLRQDPSRGFAAWVDSVDDLVLALSLQGPGQGRKEKARNQVEHLYALPEGGGDAASGSTAAASSRPIVEELYFPRDVGVRCGCLPNGDAPQSFSWSGMNGTRPPRDSYSLVQVDDLANPWAFYAVAENSEVCGQLAMPALSSRFSADVPAWLAQNPRVHTNPCRALYETHVAATKAASRGSAQIGALTLALLREEFLNIAWTGETKVVLGRLAAKATPAPEPAKTPASLEGSLRLASRHRAGASRTPQESYIGSRQMKQWMQFDGPPPILRAVDLTAQSNDGGNGVCGGDSAGGGGAGQGQEGDRPAVRRMKLKPDDVCVVIATQGLWKCLSPEEVVTIVGQNMHRMASDAAEALVSEVRRRQQPMDMPGNKEEPQLEMTIVVAYLAGERYVKDFDMERANHLDGEYFVSDGLSPAHERPSGIRGCFCRSRANQLRLEMPGGPM